MVWTLLAIAAKRDWVVHCLDVNNAFLHGDDLQKIQEMKEHLDKRFSLKDLGKLNFASYRVNDDVALADATRYKQILGQLQYLTITRLDIACAVNLLSQLAASPEHVHMVAAEIILHYLKCTPGQGIVLASKGSLELEA
ncbi:uncharacterized protein LOC129296590 [Prosopis cineraria]|uniref:uncharacterized protein LOC129296590 n=1 Tax=Prosopis cineraria TaxID=364024 RepID=UPI00240EC4FA|nr:uncharacterized protein LOC129296590 [Prosopis cineraria]